MSQPSAPGAPTPGRQPVSLSIVGQGDGPWALADDGGITIALGSGITTKAATLTLMQLAALAVKSCTPQAVAQAMQVAREQAARTLPPGHPFRVAVLGDEEPPGGPQLVVPPGSEG